MRLNRTTIWSIVSLAAITLIACAGSMKTATDDSSTTTAPSLDDHLSVDSLVVAGRLDNGFRYLIRVNKKPETRAELRLVVDVGSVLEMDEEQGLAHFVEHMAFNGTEHFAKQELIDYLEAIGMRFGADLNAYTGFDETVYMLTVPTDSTHFVEQGFQILEDWAHGLTFDAAEIDKERGVVVEEWRLRKGANQRMWEQQAPILFKDSRYAERMPIGRKAILDTFQHDTLRGFYQKWYRPELMGLIAVGDFDPVWIEEKVVEHFSTLSAGAEEPERVTYPVPDHEETLFAIASDPEATGSAVNVIYKLPVQDTGTVGAYRRSLIESIYHSMLNKRLNELLQKAEPPFLYGYSSQGRFVRSKGFFILGAGVADNGFDKGLEALLTEASRVRQFGFTRSELRRQKAQMLRGMEQAYRERDKSQSGGFAAEYVRHLLKGEPIPGIGKEFELYQQLLPSIEVEEVNVLASAWVGEENRVIMVDSPEKADLEVPDEEDLRAVFARVEEKVIEPYQDDVSDEPLVAQVPEPAQIVERDSIPELGVTTWKLSNGIRVFLKPTDFQNDQILFEGYSPGGHSLVADEDYIAATTATAVVEKGGIAEFSLIELQKKLSGKVVRVSPWIGGLREGISGSASPEDLQTMFELVYAYVTTPRADSAAFQAHQSRMRGFIENRSANPEAVYGDTVRVTMAQHHNRARPWSLELIEEMDLEKSMSIYRQRFADTSDFTFIFVGNFTLDGIEPLVRTYIGGLPAGTRVESWRDVGIDPPSGIVEKTVRRGLEPKSRSRIFFNGPFDFDGWRNDFTLEAMGDILQIKLREVLREDLGGTYTVGVGASASHYPEEEYSISLTFSCDPERVEELTGVIFEQIDSLKTAGTTDVYLDKVKEITKREREVAMKENRFWLNGLGWVDFHGLDPRRYLRYSDMVDSVSVEAVQEAAQKYFDMSNYARFVLLPEVVDSEPQ